MADKQPRTFIDSDSVMIICITVLLILLPLMFRGEPDLVDVLIQWLQGIAHEFVKVHCT